MKVGKTGRKATLAGRTRKFPTREWDWEVPTKTGAPLEERGRGKEKGVVTKSFTPGVWSSGLRGPQNNLDVGEAGKGSGDLVFETLTQVVGHTR